MNNSNMRNTQCEIKEINHKEPRQTDWKHFFLTIDFSFQWGAIHELSASDISLFLIHSLPS
jgi:hypothetical protein